uniref:NADH dehydrogenase [ubiquinone] 1 alpha subcomplex subunit 12 n=2 Tax=Oryza glumipatula TaxID=40148 RepID=A0A0E0B4W2_9ORYZ
MDPNLERLHVGPDGQLRWPAAAAAALLLEFDPVHLIRRPPRDNPPSLSRAMSKQLVSRLLGMFRSRTQVGADKFGNRYFTRVEEVDGVMKEKRWVEFKGSDQDPTTVPVEWICWLNGQRKKAPTPEELAELEARRERVKQNIELLKKKEEEEKKTGVQPVKMVGHDEVSRSKDGTDTEDATIDTDRSSEPTGTGATFKPGTWQPPT